MFSIYIIAEEDKRIEELYLHLAQEGYACSVASNGGEVISQVGERVPDLVLLESNSHSRIKELCHAIRGCDNHIASGQILRGPEHQEEGFDWDCSCPWDTLCRERLPLLPIRSHEQSP